MHIAILGSGMVGSAMAIDLVKDFKVTSFDISEQALQQLKLKDSRVNIQQADLRDYSSYEILLRDFDFAISAVPGFMGFKTLQAIIRARKNAVDISFFPEDARELHDLAIENDVTVITDCGVAPGMSNLILGHLDSMMEVTHFDCLVGGLPKKRTRPFEYKAPFSPADVLEEYKRPARYMENGFVVTKPALSDAELLDFEPVGTLESFNTDGLRSLLFTLKHIPNMKEKTLRYPGHIDLMKSLLRSGFFDETEIEYKGMKISPREFSSVLLFDQWKLGANEEEFTLMQIKITGNDKRIKRIVTYSLYDVYDVVSQTSSMARTTGYTCTAVLHVLMNGLFEKKGVYPPELLGSDKKIFDFVLHYLQERNVNYTRTEKEMAISS
jgi:saccharopine dehydrogenase-like NADP-dependent oxidoreductase